MSVACPATPSDDTLREQAYLTAREVRPLSLAAHCFVEETELLEVASRLERNAEKGSIPFVVDHGDGIASYGYAAARWALDLYQWAVTTPSAPQEQRDRIIGLLLGYGTRAISCHEEEGSGRRFAASA